MKENKLYTAQNKLLNLKFELYEISERLHHLSSGKYNGMSDSNSSTEANEISREVQKMANTINFEVVL